jgi:hypothetical protein
MTFRADEAKRNRWERVAALSASGEGWIERTLTV